MSQARADDGPANLLTLDELTTRVGLSVRNIRFYTSRGLVPPPIRRGRSGYYTPEHVARLELVTELQSHGFTLSAIERYVSGLPADATPEDIALARTMLAPWQADLPVDMAHAELEARAGRPLSEEDVRTLVALGVVRLRGPRYLVARTQLGIGMRLLDLGFPREVAESARAVYQEHGRQMAEELYELITTQLAPQYDDVNAEGFQEMMESLKPLAVGGLVTAYESAIAKTARHSSHERR
ncbi:MAG: MerR family transcriptional regulator [Nocardioides sp.]